MDIEQIDVAAGESGRVVAFPNRFGGEDPAAAAAREQLRRLLERAVDALPEAFRVVFVLREVEGCSVEETAELLGLRGETVKTRLHRARRLLRNALHDNVATALGDAFPFLGALNVVRTWAALRVMSPDGFPIYQQSESAPGAFLVTCHSGVTLAAVHALVLPPLIAAGALSADLDVFAARRFDVPKAA